MKRKLFSMLLLAFVVLAVTACNTATTTDSTTESQTTTGSTDQTTGTTTVTTQATTDTTQTTTEQTTTEEEVDAYDYGVFNGDFESNMQYWEYYTQDGFHDIDSSVFRNGEKSLSIENGSTEYTSIWQTVALDLTDGPVENDFVKFEAYFKGSDVATGTVQLIVENVIDESSKEVIAQSEKTTISSDWTKVETAVGEIPSGAEEINIVMIFETTGIVNVDDAALVQSVSNNADLATILIDGEPLDTFLSDVLNYTVYLPTTSVPTVTAEAVRTDSSVVVDEASTIDEVTTIEVTAADGTTNTYSLSFEVAGLTDLKTIQLDGENLSGFDSGKTEYYVLLDDSTIPEVTYETYYSETEVVISSVTEAPDELTLTVTNGSETTTYTIVFDVRDPLAFDMPNFDFEDTFDWQTYSATTETPAPTSERVHSGLYALKTMHQTSVWKELEFTEGIPEIGDAVKVGAWIYIDSDAPVYDLRIKVVGYTESSNSKQVFTELQIFDGIALNQWVYIESDYGDILDCDRIQFVIENNSDSVVYVDDIVVIDGISSNADADEILIDTVALEGFDSEVLEYTYLTDGENIPQVTASAANPNSDVVVTQATTVDGLATVLITAEDGTTKTYEIDFLEPSSGLLSDLKVDGVMVDGFDATKNTYYIQLPADTTVFPTVTAIPVDSNDVVTVTEGVLPGYASVEVETLSGATTVYYIYAEAINVNALSTPYPDVNFDKNLEGWGVSSTTDVTQSSENYLNGTKSLKMVGGEAWLGVDLAGGDYPSKGNAYSIGMWIYVEGQASTGFRIRLFEKENNVVIINEVMDVTENSRWVYVETAVSAEVSQEAGYLQIVISNETGETVFVDGIRFIEHESQQTSTEDTIYPIPDKNLDFEDQTEWGFWSPDGSGVSYDTSIARDTQSLMLSEGSAWVGFGFDGPDYPAKGDNVKLGFWVYVDSSTASSVGGFTIKLLEKEGPDGDVVAISYTTTDSEFAMDEWVYIETGSAVISDNPSYLQIVIEEGTDGTVYVDDIVVIQVNE